MPTPRATDPGYKGVHMRLSREKGPAKARTCSCGSVASDWAYDGLDPNERVDGKGRRYSTDLTHYRAMCRSCHFRKDRDGKCRKGHEFTEANTYHHKGQKFCRQCRKETMRMLRKRER